MARYALDLVVSQARSRLITIAGFIYHAGITCIG